MKKPQLFGMPIMFVMLLGTSSVLGKRDILKIGSGNPGLKVAINKSKAVVIYQDEPFTVGAGAMGGAKSRNIDVIFDNDFHFEKDSLPMSDQLYPFDADSAFTCDGGSWGSTFKTWEYVPRDSTLYRLTEGKLEISSDVQLKAKAKYGLKGDTVFLGFIDNKIFYWKGFDPSRIFWRSTDSRIIYTINMPKGVIDIHGATRGIQKDIGFVVFRKSPGIIHYSPYTFDFIEISLGKGKPIP